jgi:acetolactate synthase-1/2/3 large subunit
MKIRTPQDVPAVLKSAFECAVEGRKGPTLVDFPVNIQMSDTDAPLVAAAGIPFGKAQGQCTAFVKTAADFLRKASRPLIVVGEGARYSKDAVIELAARARIPLTLSWSALDLVPADCALNLGTHGVYGSRVANFALQNADLLLVLGARLDTRQTGGKLANFSVQSVKIIVDIDKNEPMKLVERGCAVEQFHICDVGTFLETMVACEPDTREWLRTVDDWKQRYGMENRHMLEGNGFVSPYMFVERLNSILPDDAIVAIDTGATLVWAYQTLKPGVSMRIFSNLGNSSMGFALPAAIGAAIAEPTRPVFCLIGDGGMQQNVQELVTAKRYGLNIKVLVFNNSGFGIIKQFQNSYLHGRHVATSCAEIYGARGVDFCALAHAYGVDAHRISSLEDICMHSLLDSGLVVYDVIIHENQGIQPKTDFGNSLCNMSPFIDSAASMVVPSPPQVVSGGWKKL